MAHEICWVIDLDNSTARLKWAKTSQKTMMLNVYSNQFAMKWHQLVQKSYRFSNTALFLPLSSTL